MKQEIFTFIENESVFVRFKRVVTESLQEFKKDPKKFIQDTFRGDPSMAKHRRYLRVGIAGSVFFWMLGMIIYIGIYYWKQPEIAKEEDKLQKIFD